MLIKLHCVGCNSKQSKLESFVAVIKHYLKLTAVHPANSSILRKVEARTTSVVLPLLNGEYLIRFQMSKDRSASAVSAIINIRTNFV